MTASWRSCVALQIVSKARNRGGELARRRSGRASPARNISPISSDSELSIVVWLAQPTRCRWMSGSKPGETACSNCRRNAVAVAAVADVVADQSRPRRGRARRGSAPPPACSACDAVARVSSCQYLPWMTDVNAVVGVALHVLPDVEHRAAGRVDERAAAADEILEQLHGGAERRQDHDVVGRQARRAIRPGRSGSGCPGRAAALLTCGLWMISPVRKTCRSGNRLRA